jgi:hypothetical protein
MELIGFQSDFGLKILGSLHHVSPNLRLKVSRSAPLKNSIHITDIRARNKRFYLLNESIGRDESIQYWTPVGK